MKTISKTTIVLMSLFVTAGCKNAFPSFSGSRAFHFLEKQCSFGPRNPGSKGYYACLDYLINELTLRADTVWTQPFTYADSHRGNSYDLKNIIAQFNPEAERHILLGAHWDTRPWADQEPDAGQKSTPIIGANDGASGVAVLLEIANIMANHETNTGVIIVLFDGEDLGASGNSRSYAQGSQYFSKNLPIPKPDHAIILDMVGDTFLHLPIERYSYRHAPKLVKTLWKKAGELNLAAFDQSLKYSIYDDHVPLWENAGIPSVDLIDFDYPNESRNYWHTQQDIPDKCSPESLAQVGTLLIHHIYGIE